jgi:hypothetical protein
MRTKAGFAVLLCLFGILSYGSYRKGNSDATSRAAVEHVAEYGNDSNGDLSVKHSASYEIGYARGHGAGWAETRQKDFVECGEKLAQVAVEASNPKIAARLLVEGYVAQSQLESAVTNQHNQPTK